MSTVLTSRHHHAGGGHSIPSIRRYKAGKRDGYPQLITSWPPFTYGHAVPCDVVVFYHYYIFLDLHWSFDGLHACSLKRYPVTLTLSASDAIRRQFYYTSFILLKCVILNKQKVFCIKLRKTHYGTNKYTFRNLSSHFGKDSLIM